MKRYIIFSFILITANTNGQILPEWEINSLNTGKAFTNIQTLSDGSIVSELIYCTSSSDLPHRFYDSKNNLISYNNNYTYDHQLINHKTLIKFDKDGVYQWSNPYNNTNPYSDTENEFDFIGYKVLKDMRIVVLVKYNEKYFQNKEEEEQRKIDALYEDGYDGYEEEINSVSVEVEEPVKERGIFGLQFIDPSTGGIDSVLFIQDFNSHKTEIYNIENLENNIIILTGRTDSPQIKISDTLMVENENQFQGDFVAAINLKNGGIIWSDIITYGQREDFYLHETHNNSHISVSPDGSTIYYGNKHYGDATFSNGKHIQSQIAKTNLNMWAYLISYTKQGKINWIKSNESVSYPHTIKSENKGVYIAQSSYGSQSFERNTDTTNLKYVCISFVNKEGKELWVLNLPISKINSIQIDKNNLPVIQGTYNGISLRTPKFQINDNFRLNDKNDFFIVKLDKKGNISTLLTKDLRIQDHLYSVGANFVLLGSDDAYLSYHARKYFTKEEREKIGSTMHDQNAFGDLCKLIKINLKTLKSD